MKEYKGIIDKLIRDSYEESLVIDVFNDKIYKYAYVNDDIVKLEELSYADYLNKCNKKCVCLLNGIIFALVNK